MGFVEWVLGNENIKGEKVHYVLTKDKTKWCKKCESFLITKKERRDMLCKECATKK